MAGDWLHGVTEALEQAAANAVSVAEGIDGHRTVLRSAVDQARAGWSGQARLQFDRAFEHLEESGANLVRALHELGQNTGSSANHYHAADEAGQAQMNKVLSLGGFGTALGGRVGSS
jgi:WXG100 family type VII secretion target